MTKFHVNNSGEAGQCRATLGGCPFGDDSHHYETPEIARKEYELSMESSQFSTVSRRTPTEEAAPGIDHYKDIEKGEWSRGFDRRLPPFRRYTESETAASIADATDVYERLRNQDLGPKSHAALELIRRSLNPQTTPRGKILEVSPDHVKEGLKSARSLIEKVNPLAAEELKKAYDRIVKMRQDTSN